MRRRELFNVAIVAVAWAVAGCQRTGPEATAAPGGSSVQIARISPDPSSPLQAGDRVNLEVSVNYTLNAGSGVITLVVQSADNSTIANYSEVVTKGSGTVALKSSFAVPETNSVLVFTPLSAQGQSSTSTVDARAFKVLAK